MAQYEVTAPKDRNVSVRGGGRQYVFLQGTKQVVEASGDVAGLIEAHGCSVEHVGDEPTVEAIFHAEKVAAARAAGPEDLNDFGPIDQPVGAQPKNQGSDAEASDEGDDEDATAYLKRLCEEHRVETGASTEAGLKRALTAAGINWRSTDLEDTDGGEEE